MWKKFSSRERAKLLNAILWIHFDNLLGMSGFERYQ